MIKNFAEGVYTAPESNGHHLTNHKFSAFKSEPLVFNETVIDSNLFLNVFLHSPVGTALCSADGQFLKVNSALCETFGYEAEEFSQISWETLLEANDGNALKEFIVNLQTENKQTTNLFEQRLRHKQGHFLWTQWLAAFVNEGNLKFPFLILQLQSVSHRRRSDLRMLHKTTVNPATGATNRVFLMERLAQTFKQARLDPNNRFALLYLSFDRFELVNSHLENHAGDWFHAEVTQRLASHLRNCDTIAHLTGDEFAILLENLKNPDETQQVVKRLEEAFLQPFILNEREIRTSLSIGAALWTAQYDRPEEMFRDASTAFYHAKKSGRAHCEVFNAETHKRISHLQQIEKELRFALERDEFTLYYQPILAMDTNRLAGFETLIRWNHPQLGQISPVEFISLAEANGMISQLGLWILREACRQFAEWQGDQGKADFWLSVNLSSKQLVEPDIARKIAAVLRETKISPSQLKLEITESAMIDDLESALKILKELKELGISLSVDDFGTGYSSLSNLHQLPVNSLKIDRSFISNPQTPGDNWEIVKSIIMMAQSLNLEVIAEGIENGEQVVRLLNLGCALGQGFYFAPPLEKRAVEKLLNELQNPSRAKTSDEIMEEYFNGEYL